MSVAAVLVCALCALVPVLALDNGVALVPPLGWSSWNSFRYDVTEDLIKQAFSPYIRPENRTPSHASSQTAMAMAKNGLRDAGYEYVLIDDGWTTCDRWDYVQGKCARAGARDSSGRIVADPKKFPSGMKALADYVHSLGLKIGIYTAVSHTTCGGFQSSLGHEAIDAQTFADWGMDLVKHDTCNLDCDVQCIKRSTALMRDGLNKTGKPIVYYVDDGNDSSGQRLFNPFHHSVPSSHRIKVADAWQDLVWVWGPDTCNMWKSWFDRKDTWESFLDNLHMQIGLAYYQSCGAFNMPDMVTIGQGALTAGEYRAQMFVYAVLGSPIILGCKLDVLDNASLSLLTAPEVLEVDQDSECVQGSLIKISGSIEAWAKPLSDGSFAVALVNTGEQEEKITLRVDLTTHTSFYPASFLSAHVRDLWNRQDLGVYAGAFTATVAAHDGAIYRFKPIV
eukprot:m51a1_g14216 putative alpha-galactosidase (450) ;mRNA; f:180907-182653